MPNVPVISFTLRQFERILPYGNHPIPERCHFVDHCSLGAILGKLMKNAPKTGAISGKVMKKRT